MRQEHRIRAAVPYFFRPDINIFAVSINVNEKLGGIQDFVDGLHGVFAPDNRKKRDCIQDEQEGTGNPEKVPHHQVRRPGGLQIGQAVKHIERVFPRLLNHIVDINRKRFKSVGQGQFHRPDFRTSGNQRLMVRETEIDDIAMIPDRLVHIGLHKQPELGKIRYAPDHVVPEPDIVKRSVHLRNTR